MLYGYLLLSLDKLEFKLWTWISNVNDELIKTAKTIIIEKDSEISTSKSMYENNKIILETKNSREDNKQ